MDSSAAVAITGILAASIIGPTSLSLLTARQRRNERREDYARQDAVAKAAEDREARQAEATREVARQAAEAAELLLRENKRVAEQSAAAAEVTNGKLNQIHELVNSTLTGAMQAELVAREAQLELVRRFQPDQVTLIVTLNQAINELNVKLSDRVRQTEIADAQVLPSEGR